jgi:hypothetical protein
MTAAVAAVAVSASVGSGPRRPAPSPRYGGIPSWIPKAKIPVGRVAHASARHPWLAIEGDTVQVTLAGGSAELTAVGPQVPDADVATDPLKTRVPCTFDVTFAHITGSMPIEPSAFTIVDELGHLHHPRVTVLGAASRRDAERSLTLRVKSVLAVGAGTLRWAPRGGRPIVSFDFDVEVD